MAEKTVEDYLKLPYHIEITRDDDEENPGFAARVVELPGCITQGDTFEELGEMIDDAMRGWITVALKDGIPVPEPAPDEDYSGKFVTRVSRSLHRQLAKAAEREGVSLNQFVNVALATAVGQRNPVQMTYSSGEKKPSFSVAEKRGTFKASRTQTKSRRIKK
ncbi:MAG: toxin-antitoxin system HicB family antitoxin [Chloroflexi bacterium]|nr:toxin-antitoxin system HicB family antitoxin [Chloroflexota bacterium]